MPECITRYSTITVSQLSASPIAHSLLSAVVCGLVCVLGVGEQAAAIVDGGLCPWRDCDFADLCGHVGIAVSTEHSLYKVRLLSTPSLVFCDPLSLGFSTDTLATLPSIAIRSYRGVQDKRGIQSSYFTSEEHKKTEHDAHPS